MRLYVPSKKNITKFIRESNLIDGVDDPKEDAQSAKAWEYLSSQDKLTVEVVKETHRLIMINEPMLRPGSFRRQAVWIGGREGVNWKKIPAWMKRWLKVANLPGIPMTDHVSFEMIHPFIDGNGRTGRMLLNWESLKKDNKIYIIKSETKHEEYYPIFK